MNSDAATVATLAKLVTASRTYTKRLLSPMGLITQGPQFRCFPNSIERFKQLQSWLEHALAFTAR